MLAVNTSVGIIAKSDGSRVAAFSYNDFFVNSGTNECDGNNGGDPTVAYDGPSGKWVIGDFAWLNSNKGRCSSASRCPAGPTRSPPPGRSTRCLPATAGSRLPKFGVGPDGLNFITNNFRRNSYTGAGVYGLKGRRSARRPCRCSTSPPTGSGKPGGYGAR